MAEARSRGIAWAGAVNLVGGATGSLIGLVLAAVVGRQLGTEGAGTYFLVVAVFMIVSNLAELGADTGLVRHVSAARATDRLDEVPRLVVTAVKPVLVVGAVLATGAGAWLLLGADGRVSGLPGISPPFAFVALVLALLASLIALMLAITRGLGDVLAYPLLQNVLLPVLRVGAVLAVVLTGGGATAVLGAWMAPVPVVLLLATVVAMRMVKRRVGSIRPADVPLPERRRVTREFWSFSAARGVSAGVEVLLEWFDVILVGLLTSPEAAGIYAVVTRCARAGEVIQQAARIAVGPEISAAMARGAVEEASHLYGLVTAAMIWLAWPFFLVLAIFSDVVLTVFGPGFGDGALSLAVLSLAMALATAAGTVQTILLMGGRSTWQLADKSAALALNVVLNLVLVPLWGIEGAAVSWAVTILADTAIVVYQVQRLMGIRPQGRQPLVAAGLAVGVVGSISVLVRLALGPSPASLAVTLAVAGVAYLAASWVLRTQLGLVGLIRRRTAG